VLQLEGDELVQRLGHVRRVSLGGGEDHAGDQRAGEVDPTPAPRTGRCAGDGRASPSAWRGGRLRLGEENGIGQDHEEEPGAEGDALQQRSGAGGVDTSRHTDGEERPDAMDPPATTARATTRSESSSARRRRRRSPMRWRTRSGATYCAGGTAAARYRGQSSVIASLLSPWTAIEVWEQPQMTRPQPMPRALRGLGWSAGDRRPRSRSRPTSASSPCSPATSSSA
jgi:hypothetical protein